MADYDIAVAHLYGNLMNTYGDYGNIIGILIFSSLLVFVVKILQFYIDCCLVRV